MLDQLTSMRVFAANRDQPMPHWDALNATPTDAAHRAGLQLAVQLFAKYLIHHTWIRLPTRLLHHLTDKKAKKFVLATTILINLILIGGKHLIDQRSMAPLSETCFKPFSSTIVLRHFTTLKHIGKYILGNATRNCAIADKFNKLAKHAGRHRTISERFSRFIQRAK